MHLHRKKIYNDKMNFSFIIFALCSLLLIGHIDAGRELSSRFEHLKLVYEMKFPKRIIFFKTETLQ